MCAVIAIRKREREASSRVDEKRLLLSISLSFIAKQFTVVRWRSSGMGVYYSMPYQEKKKPIQLKSWKGTIGTTKMQRKFSFKKLALFKGSLSLSA